MMYCCTVNNVQVYGLLCTGVQFTMYRCTVYNVIIYSSNTKFIVHSRLPSYYL